MATLELHNIRKNFGAVEVIKSVDLSIRDGEFVVFVGPSGCGKSTLLRMISGLEEPSSGDIILDGERVNDHTPFERGVAMVFQSYALYPHMTVAENLGFPLKMANARPEEIATKVRAAASVLQLEALLDRTPDQLSGGQKQRVAMGRTIVRDPSLFLFDEPLSNLDADLRIEMRIEIEKLHKRLDATMIYVTHDQVEAMTLADRIVVLRDGTIEQIGAPIELYEAPANTFVATFLGSPKMNFLSVTLVGSDANSCSVELTNGTRITLPFSTGSERPGAGFRLGIRPEDIIVDETENRIPFEMEIHERLGPTSYLYGRCGDEKIVAEYRGRGAIDPADVVSLGLKVEHAHLFNADGTTLRIGSGGGA